ncbi:hypothetical protein GCM10023321_32210 [Pseudonocardia eucalypti]|uniref:Uncharacterized protein n=1 Tax=Pseudonocardia eucalypti TaxID=648755 RepID=A0ABP9Q5I1_9PSEU|nr:hypothetical protein [Pseudonocardia eucalypti]
MNVAAIHNIAAPSNIFPNDSDPAADSHPRRSIDTTAHVRRVSAVVVAIELLS